jgi:hypothetical protein
MMPEWFGYWLAGFTDGEATFSYGQRDKAANDKRAIIPHYGIILRADDAEILNKIHRYLGTGKIYKMVRKQAPGQYKSKPQLQFRIIKKKELLALIRIFDKYTLQSKKLKDYIIWKKMVLLHCSTRSWAKKYDKMRELALQLSEGKNITSLK